MNLSRRFASETLGTALLLATVVGSGIMGERLAGGNVAVALLANTIATGADLVALILTFGGISGAHFNPIGAFGGVAAANVIFELPVFFASQKVRTGVFTR